MEVKLNIGGFDNSYAAYNSTYSSKSLLSYTNKSDKPIIVKSVTMPMGTGRGEFTAGDYAVGNGNEIEFYVSVNGIQSSSVKVSHDVASVS